MPTQSDVRFAQAAVNAKFVDVERAKEALRALKQAEAVGVTGSISDVFVKKGYLTKEQVSQLLKALGLDKDAAKDIKKIGDFELLRRIGAGGMGAVYLAKHSNGAEVALKVLPAHLASDEDYVVRFQREASVAYQLNHPHIVKCVAAGHAGEHHYLAMEYVDGGSVADRLKGDTALPEAQALSILVGVCQALQYAHETAGVVHRDIKPANILLARDGGPKLADLGLARAHGDLRVTQTGVSLGTPHYMSPEQAEGKKELDIRSDIYSLGATFYHMVCGQPPFQGDTALAVMMQHLESELPSPQDKNAAVSDGVCHLIEKCMAKRPGDRYQTPAELLEDVERVAAGEAPKSERLAPGVSSVQQKRIDSGAVRRYRESRREEKKGSKRPLAVAVAAMVAVGIVGLMVVTQKPGSQETAATPKPGSQETAATARPSSTDKVEAIAGMFRAAEEYAAEHPDDFREIVDRFETTQKRAEGTEHEFKAKDAAKACREKWDKAAREEFEKRRLSSEASAQDGQFDQAKKVWEEFPKGLLAEGLVGLVEEERRRLDERAGRLADELSGLAGPLLAKDSSSLTAADVKALLAAKAKGGSGLERHGRRAEGKLGGTGQED